MEQYRIYICDDEPRIFTDVLKKVKECLPGALIKTFTSGIKLMEELDREVCDILLLDIDMPDVGGMEVASWLLKQDKRPLLVFVTSHDELVYDSFQYHPFGFIRKDHLDQEIKPVLDSCINELQSNVKYFYFRSEGKDIRVALRDIRYFEADGNYLKLFLSQDKYRLRSTLTAIENSIGIYGFIRIHKGFLVNQMSVHKLGNEEIYLTDGTVLPLGKTYLDEVRNEFMRYLRV